MPKAKVNGVEVEFENGMTVLQVAELAGEAAQEFWFEGLPGAPSTEPEEALAFRAHWRKDEGWVKGGTSLPLADEQGRARFAATERLKAKRPPAGTAGGGEVRGVGGRISTRGRR